MRSRLLIGATGWLLGAVTATAGSLYAVDQLGQGLLTEHTKRVSVAMVNAELAQNHPRHSAPAVTQTPSRTPRPSSSASPSGRPAHAPHNRRNQAGAEVEFSTPGGTAGAVCSQGKARLLYESPGQGYGVDDLVTGPATAASVTFTNSSGGVVLRVTCSAAGQPAKQVSTFTSGSGSKEEQ